MIIGNVGELITVLIQYSRYIVWVAKLSCFRYERYSMWALPKKMVLMPVI